MKNAYDWYRQLSKPVWAPPSFLFGPVWTILYMLIAFSFGSVFYRYLYPQIPADSIPFFVVLPLMLNLFFNLIFTPIQFRLRSLSLASVDVVLVWITLVWALSAIWIADIRMNWVVWMNIPYLLWVTFASILQITIWYKNRHTHENN